MSEEKHSDLKDVFAAFVAMADAGRDVDFEQWVKRHPEAEAELRRLYEAWEAAGPLRAKLEQDASTTALFFRRHATEPQKWAPGLSPGKVVGDFRLVSLIGHGGMGQVWEAEQEGLGGRKVAVKFVHPDRVTPRHLELFQREARAGGRLNHPGIVGVHAYGESEGLAWIAMELVEGGWTLRDFIDDMARQAEKPEDYDRRVADFVAKIADAMQTAHEAGVIHRDLKPRNLLIGSDEQPRVTDFGLARITDEASISKTGDFAGTYHYMSPEQLAARRMGLDHRTDIFSLGVVLYEMLAVRRPFEGDTTHQVAEQILTLSPPDLQKIRSRTPRDLAVICNKALEKPRERRYQTMAELAADLRRFLANESIRAKPPGRVRKLQLWAQRNPAKSLACAVAGIAFLLVSVQTTRLSTSHAALKTKTGEAEANAVAEKRRADEVLHLAALQEYDDLLASVGALWPAHPDRIGAFEDWIERAQTLVNDLPTHIAKREELRAEAIPQSEEERRADRESHPNFARLAPLQAEIDAKQAALDQRRGIAAVKLPEHDWSSEAEDPHNLNEIAWELVKPGRVTFGGEARGLIMAQRALELAEESDDSDLVANFRDTESRAFFALGRDEEALAASRQALATATDASKQEYASYLRDLQGWIAAARSAEGFQAAEKELATLRGELSRLKSSVDERRDWRFPPEHWESRWWNNQLTRLIESLESLLDPKTGLLSPAATSAEHGWSVPRRLALADSLRKRFAPGGEFDVRWELTLPLIRAAYPGLQLSPQFGLVPIGSDPASGLWEFWHIASGEEPRRDPRSKVLLLGPESGLVFVLLPGGQFTMGAQRDNPSGPNYDPSAGVDQRPHSVKLAAFFLSKYEMTQGQWMRVMGINPSLYVPGSEPGGITLLNPVEHIAWTDCQEALRRLDLGFPTEAQWEYAARGGSETPWWTGADKESLEGASNLADLSAKKDKVPWDEFEEWLEDGFVVHSPVHRFSANGFGLHSVHGNVAEWCKDAYGNYFLNVTVGDGERVVTPVRHRVFRGGSYDLVAGYARSADRRSGSPREANETRGVRPARLIHD